MASGPEIIFYVLVVAKCFVVSKSFPVDSLAYSSTTSLPQRSIYLNKVVVEPEGSLTQEGMSNVDVNATCNE